MTKPTSERSVMPPGDRRRLRAFVLLAFAWTWLVAWLLRRYGGATLRAPG